MTLNGKDGQFLVVQAFDAVVIEIQPGDFQAVGQGIADNAPAMVLRGYQNSLSGLFFDGLVGAPVTKL